MHMRECIPQMTWRVIYMFLCCQIRPTHSRIPELKKWCGRQELCYAMAMKLAAADLTLTSGSIPVIIQEQHAATSVQLCWYLLLHLRSLECSSCSNASIVHAVVDAALHAAAGTCSRVS